MFYVCFSAVLVFCHPLQYLSFKLGGYRAHKLAVDVLNMLLLACLYLTGSRCTYHNPHTLPKEKPLIIVANHQSMFDIIAIGWFMRRYHPKFVSKIELGKGWPSISFNLKKGGSVLIDRKKPRQAIPALTAFAEYIKDTNRSAVIFPEGTRSKTGAPKTFTNNGLKILLRSIPDAMLIPVTINHAWKLLRYGSFPIEAGVHLSVKVQEPIASAGRNPDEVLAEVEESIKKDIVI